MDEFDKRTRVFEVDLIKPGDIVLTTTPEPVSQVIRKAVSADISHAMICVGRWSVIDSTGDGVHARNLARIIIEPGCAAYVLRPIDPLTESQLQSVIMFARAAVGTRYTISGAAKSVLAGFAAGRRQFCSRLVAQAYRKAGRDLVTDADFCHPGELLRSAMLIEVSGVLRNLPAGEETQWREDTDNVQAMRDSTNKLLQEARKLAPQIESLNDIDAYLVEHQDGDAHLVQALRSSRYLDLWSDELVRNSWQYHAALMDGVDGSDLRKQTYCEGLLADNERGPNRFVMNHAGYVAVHALHPRNYFALKIELYERLAHLHAQRIAAATGWLERRGLLQPTAPTLLRPHTPEWFTSLREWNPQQAAMTKAAIAAAKSSDACGICADEPARDFALINPVAAGPGTLRLCDDCYNIRSIDEPMKPFD